MEAAIALASIVAVVITCIGAITAVSQHVRCVDAAREAARLVARGDDVSGSLLPARAAMSVNTEDGMVTVRVESSTLLPGLTVSADAVAVMESIPE